MRSKIVLPVVVSLAISVWLVARAEEQPKAAPTEAPVSAVDKAKADWEAADKAAKAADAELVPLKAAMQKADAAFAGANKAAITKRQQATEAKNLAGDSGVRDLQQAEANVPNAAKDVTDSTTAKANAEQALAAAKEAALPLQQAFDAADKIAKEAETAAKIAAHVANRIDDEAKMAETKATVQRHTATAAKAAIAQAQRDEQRATLQAASAARALTDAEAQKKAADEALANAKSKLTAATAAQQEAEQAAVAAEANAKIVTAADKQQAAAEAAAKRKAVESAANGVKQAQQVEQNAKAQVATVGKKLADAPGEKKSAEEALAKLKTQLTAASETLRVAEQAAQAAQTTAKTIADDAGKSADEKQKAAADATAKRQAADVAKAALAQAKQDEQKNQARIAAAAKSLSEGPTELKAAEIALAAAKKQVTAATTAQQTAEQAAQKAEAAAKTVAERADRTDEQKQQATAAATAKRKAADTAKVNLTQAQAALSEAQATATGAAQALIKAASQKKASEEAAVAAKKHIEDATAAAAAAEKAAEEFAKLALEKKTVAAQATAKRKKVAAAAALLSQAQQAEQTAQTQVAAATKAVNEVLTPKKATDEALRTAKNQLAAAVKAAETADKAAQEATAAAQKIAAAADKSDAEKQQAAADAKAKRKAADTAKAALAPLQQSEQSAAAKAAVAAQKLADAEKQKQTAVAAVAQAKQQITAATEKHQAEIAAGGELLQLDVAKEQADADAAAKRKTATAARTALTPVQQKLDQAINQANTAKQNVIQAEARKKIADEALEALKKKIEAAKQSFAADDKAAAEAEAAAAPLKVEAEKTRAAYTAAVKAAEAKRNQAELAKAGLYRAVAAGQVAQIMDSPSPPKPVNRIDELVFAKLNELGIKPVLCSDSVFIRRAYLDLTGKLPSADEAKKFLQSSDPKKREALVDRLLDQTAHYDYWAMKWADILRVKAEFPVKVWPNAAQAYHRWLWESVAHNKPYDQFARELLTSSGSNFRVGPVNFYRAIQDRTPEGIAAVTGLSLLGARIHLWPEERRAGLATFFSQVGYKPTSEWKEEIVFWDPLNSSNVPESTAAGIDAIAKSITATNQIPQALEKPIEENHARPAMFPDGTKTTIPADRDPREVFADWLIRPENPWFSKAIVNRTWAWAMGRGIVQEPDDIRDNNPPSNPELLAYLEKELVANHYDLKKLKRLIFTSATYQFSSMPRFKDAPARANFASYQLRRVEAEVLIDAVNRITGSTDLYTSAVPEPFSYIPNDMSAVALADGSVTSSFLTLFGRSARATGMEAERVNELASSQWLHMLNSAKIQTKLANGPRIAELLSTNGKPTEIAEKLYLTILSRLPTEADLKIVAEYGKPGTTKGRDAWIDLAWALINSPEFLLRH